ncbi:hypothetical protein BGZ83_006890 [Gryganskiella cystojenkinii]|nr:hypothetical protein BGZ83_006890 [Gryganskiella cystojenkinii]
MSELLSAGDTKSTAFDGPSHANVPPVVADSSNTLLVGATRGIQAQLEDTGLQVGPHSAIQPIPLADLTVEPLIVAHGLDLSNEVAIDGSATLEIKYL